VPQVQFPRFGEKGRQADYRLPDVMPSAGIGTDPWGVMAELFGKAKLGTDPKGKGDPHAQFDKAEKFLRGTES